MKLHDLVKVAVMSAIMCVVGPLSISIPISPVPITFINLIIYFALYICGTKYASISYLIYMLLGFVGLPVFSNFSGGPTKILGPTGGYIIGLIFMSLIAGYFINKHGGNVKMHIIGMIFGNLVLYLFGSIWLAFQMHISFLNAILIGVVPFIIGDIIKIIIALLFGNRLRNIIKGVTYK